MQSCTKPLIRHLPCCQPGPFLMQDKALFISDMINTKYYCWCPDDGRSQDISSHGTDQVMLENIPFSAEIILGMDSANVRSTSIRCWSDMKLLDRYLIDFDPMIFAICQSVNSNALRQDEHSPKLQYFKRSYLCHPWLYQFSCFLKISLAWLGLTLKSSLQRQCGKFGQIAMPKTCENWLGLVNICIYCAHWTHWNLPGTALLSGFQSSQGALKFTE